jgi:hypothetical protein
LGPNFYHHLQVAKSNVGVRVTKSDKKTVDQGFMLTPIVTEKVRKAIKNLLDDVVLESLWRTRKHTRLFKAGNFLANFLDLITCRYKC